MRFLLPSIKRPTAPPSFRLLPSTVSLSELYSTIWLARVGHSRKLGWAAEHMIDSSVKRIYRLSFEF